MAATAPKRAYLRPSVLLMLVSFGSSALADRADDVRTQISHIATSLTAGNVTDAMVPFDKSYGNYDQLKNDFLGLTSFQIENEIDVTDEQDTDTGANLTVTWMITLTDRSTNQTEHRTADLEVRLVLKNRKWKIVGFTPIDIFSPLQKQTPKR